MSGTSAISTTSRRELSSSFFFLQGKVPKENHDILTEILACLIPGRTYQQPYTIRYYTVWRAVSIFQEITEKKSNVSPWLYTKMG